MRINLSGPRSLDHLMLMGIAGSLLKADGFVLSEMRYGAANGKAYQCKVGNVMYNTYIFRGKDQINIDVQEAYDEASVDMEATPITSPSSAERDYVGTFAKEERTNQKIGGPLDDYS